MLISLFANGIYLYVCVLSGVCIYICMFFCVRMSILVWKGSTGQILYRRAMHSSIIPKTSKDRGPGAKISRKKMRWCVRERAWAGYICLYIFVYKFTSIVMHTNIIYIYILYNVTCVLPAFCTYHLCQAQPHLEHVMLQCTLHLEHMCDFCVARCSKYKKSKNICSKCALRTSNSWFLECSKSTLFFVWKTPDVLSERPAL